jgi:hypothetical protein
MATKEQTEIHIAELLRELNNKESEYTFHIPGWSPENSSMGLRWMRSQLWEGFYVAYQIDHAAKRVNFKSWEFGESEPAWESANA